MNFGLTEVRLKAEKMSAELDILPSVLRIHL